MCRGSLAVGDRPVEIDLVAAERTLTAVACQLAIDTEIWDTGPNRSFTSTGGNRTLCHNASAGRSPIQSSTRGDCDWASAGRRPLPPAPTAGRVSPPPRAGVGGASPVREWVEATGPRTRGNGRVTTTGPACWQSSSTRECCSVGRSIRAAVMPSPRGGSWHRRGNVPTRSHRGRTASGSSCLVSRSPTGSSDTGEGRCCGVNEAMRADTITAIVERGHHRCPPTRSATGSVTL